MGQSGVGAVARAGRERPMRVLVTGAAGYIGSTTAEHLLDLGARVVALDDLSTGDVANVPERADFVEGDCGDPALIGALGTLDACVHFAARIEPSESMRVPERYFANNVAGSFRLFEALINAGCERVVFSSSCAVYGNQTEMPIEEDRPTAPHSPYGQSKLMVEDGLRWLAARGRLRSASLRYFNAAGATARHPERHRPETHLIPIALEVAGGRRGHLEIFGGDYPTRDGTCVRDYVHVSDLADAHVRALDALGTHESLTINLGTGTGSSNLEVVEAVREVTGRALDARVVDRRPGDPAEAVAGGSLAHDLLGWTPQRSSLREVVADAWAALSEP
ncbi:MAG: UDP-glucose 4-epimerase GalE [Acidimicrobiales bacterium]